MFNKCEVGVESSKRALSFSEPLKLRRALNHQKTPKNLTDIENFLFIMYCVCVCMCVCVCVSASVSVPVCGECFCVLHFYLNIIKLENCKCAPASLNKQCSVFLCEYVSVCQANQTKRVFSSINFTSPPIQNADFPLTYPLNFCLFTSCGHSP